MSRSTTTQRLLDRFLGRLFVVLLGLMKSKRDVPDSISSIGFIQPTAIGDSVMCLSLIDALQTRYNCKQQVIFCSASNALVFVSLYPDERRKVIICDFRKPLESIRQLRKYRVDLLVDLCPWSYVTAIYSFFSAASCTVGFASGESQRKVAYDLAIDHMDNIHEYDNLRKIAKRLTGADRLNKYLDFVLHEPKLIINYSKTVVFHTCPGGSQAVAKQWPIENWVSLANKLGEEDFVILFTGVVRDKPFINQILNKLANKGICTVNAAGIFSLNNTAYLLKHVLITVTIDTGLVHIATAVNGKVLSLHGPTSSKRWGPISEFGYSIDSPHPSSGYITFGFEGHKDSNIIMRSIDPDIVYEKIKKIIDT